MIRGGTLDTHDGMVELEEVLRAFPETKWEDDGVKGPSPTPGMLNSINCPVRKGIGLSGRSRSVLIVGDSWMIS